MSDDTSYRAYRETVEALASEVRDRVRSGDDMWDSIFEVTDGNWWTIYTHAAARALVHSDNEDAYFDQMGGSIEANSYDEIVCKLAAYALMQDVYEAYVLLIGREAANPDGEE
ncbi:MAG TPA: hypothetical protein VEA41_22605 [Salinarimonas sp.]|nr:hypothetical protein [Salinarimonas sp.]